MSLKSLKNKLFVAFGFITLSLGILGIFLPLLPTTPFLLLASTLFMHGSKRWHSWLTNHSLFGPFIHNYVNHKAITLSMKITILITLWLSLTTSRVMSFPALEIIRSLN